MGLPSEPRLQVIIPARNEQDCIATCLRSLAGQQGIDFQITVVDDGSTDDTRRIAESFPGVRVIGAEQVIPGAIGKCNALICGARDARSEWLLFTDADTFHYAGSLAASVREAEGREVDLLSYSPEQDVASWSERALMPVVFAELARTYPPARVNDSAEPLAAANGQYILARRKAYEACNGHRAVAGKVLEDVELARLFKSRGHKIWFRHGAGLVKTRMYRSFAGMVEGWTKNLALLFQNTLRLAIIRLLEFTFIIAAAFIGVTLMGRHHPGFALLCLLLAFMFYLNFLARILSAHFSWRANLAALFGLPLFSFLLVRSYIQSNIRGAITWKGRIYTQSAPHPRADSST